MSFIRYAENSAGVGAGLTEDDAYDRVWALLQEHDQRQERRSTVLWITTFTFAVWAVGVAVALLILSRLLPGIEY